MSEVTPPPPPPPAMPPVPPPSPMGMPASQPPSNNLAFAIIVTILCCLPFGIVAIIKAAEVNGKWAQGDYAGATASAAAAKKWSIIGLVTGLVVIVLYFVFVVVVGIGASTSNY